MTEATFRAQRRQKFLTEQYYELNKAWLAILISENEKADDHNRNPADPASAGIAGSTFKEKLNLLKLHYTAGCSIEELKPRYVDVVHALGKWHEAYRAYVKALAVESGDDLRENGTPLQLEDLSHFQITMDMASLGVLLGDGPALRRIAEWMNSYRGGDLLFEELISRAVPDPGRDTTEYFHVEPYDPLIDAFYSPESAQESSAKVKKYLTFWYKSFEGLPWHDGHLHGAAHQMPYYGYWSFEAAAICVLHDIDDTPFRDHLLYPKDLADWARANNSIARLSPNAGAHTAGVDPSLRCEAGQPCPKSGYWLTPAKANSRKYFRQDDVMPTVTSDYGSTIWQWDNDQSDPKL